MKPKDILHEEQKLFFAKQKEYEEKYSKKNEYGEIVERAIMPHKGYNFSMSYDAFENAMERYANQKIDEYKAVEKLAHFISEKYVSTAYKTLLNASKDFGNNYADEHVLMRKPLENQYTVNELLDQL